MFNNLLNAKTTPTRRYTQRFRTPRALFDSLEPRTLLSGDPTLFTLTGGATNVVIAPGDTTPSSTDGTLLGWTTPGSNTPLASTFTITDLGGLTLNDPAVTITDDSGTLFTVSQPTLSSGTGTFTVTYDPTTATAGKHSATIHLASNDPNQPDFTFTVAANQQPTIDLVPAIGTMHSPATILPGITKKIQVPVFVRNTGTDQVRGFTPPIDFNLFLRDSNGTDTWLSTAMTPKLRGLTPGHTKNVILFFTVPAATPTGTYSLVLKMNTAGGITETDLDNDTVLASQTLNIVQPFNNLSANILSSTLPTDINAGQKLSGSVDVSVTSLGNVQLKGGTKVSINILARDTTTNTDTFLGSGRFSISRWMPNQSGTFTITLKHNSAPALPPGTYTLVAVITSTIGDNDASDNTSVSSITLTVT